MEKDKRKELLLSSHHNVPSANSPYVRAKHYQVVEKDYKEAVVWFWKAINAGDRVDSALKDMAVVMKQTNRTEEAIEAIKSFRHLCSKQSQPSLDNLLIDLYKKCGRLEDQIHLYKQKLGLIYEGKAFNGRTTKAARSHGKKFQISIEQEMARLLGNLGWAYMQQGKYEAAEGVYRKAQQIRPDDASTSCNLGNCLMRRGRFDEAFRVLDDVVSCCRYTESVASESRKGVMNRAEELMRELEELRRESSITSNVEEILERLDVVIRDWTLFRSTEVPMLEELFSLSGQGAC